MVLLNLNLNRTNANGPMDRRPRKLSSLAVGHSSTNCWQSYDVKLNNYVDRPCSFQLVFAGEWGLIHCPSKAMGSVYIRFQCNCSGALIWVSWYDEVGCTRWTKFRWRWCRVPWCSARSPTLSRVQCLAVSSKRNRWNCQTTNKTRCRAKPDVSPPGCTTKSYRNLNAIYRISPKISSVDKTNKKLMDQK